MRLALILVMVFSTTAYAAFDTNNAQQQGQAQGQGQLQAAVSLQGQAQKAVNDQSVNVSEDGADTKIYASTWPSLSGTEGVSEGNIYSVFGGIGKSDTEAYKKIITQMQAIEASTILTAEQKQDKTVTLLNKLMDTNKKKRFLGLFWETSGKDLLNVFGILAWDSFWKEGQHPFVKY